MLFQMLVANSTLQRLNISCNVLGEVSSYVLLHIDPVSSMGCRACLLQAGGKHVQEGMEENQTLTELDLRLTKVASESEYAINQHISKNQERRQLNTQNKPS